MSEPIPHSYTEQDRLNAEVEKLRVEKLKTTLETKVLRNPFRSATFMLSLASLIVAVCVAGYQLTKSGLDRREERIRFLETEMEKQREDADQFRKVSNELAELLQNKTKLADLQKPGSELGKRLRPLFFPINASPARPPGFPVVSVGVSIKEDGTGSVSVSGKGQGTLSGTPQFVVVIYDLERKTRLQEITCGPRKANNEKKMFPFWSLSASFPVSLNSGAKDGLLLPSQIELEL